MTTQAKTDLLRQIRDELLDLQDSPLLTYRQENNYFPVIGQGNHDAMLMFVGEAPGENEAKTAIPFCGASGRVLDELFNSIGLNRPDVYITNIVKDRPPQNRDPKPEEIELYAPYLDRQISIIQPKVLITLGRFSMEYLMKRYGLAAQLQPISKIHGHLFQAKDDFFGAGNSPHILPLYHPASCLYNPTLKKVLMDDIQVVKQFI